MSIYNTIKGKMHNAIQNDFWLQIAEAISEELEIERAKKKEKITLNDLDSLNDADLFNLASKYGYEPNLILDDSYENLKEEVKSIPYRIKNKTAVKGLKFSFSQANQRLGEIYNTTYNITNIARLIDYDTTVDNVINYVDEEPFIGVVPEIIFFINPADEQFTLDDGKFLDEIPTWYLSRQSIIITTKHFTIEYFFDRLIEEEGLNYSITPSYVNFMLSEANYNRRVTNIPHIGIQINSIIDNSLFFNTSSLEDYTIPSLELQSAMLSIIGTEDVEDFKYFVIGIGQKGLISSDYPNIYSNAQLHLPFTDIDNLDSVVDVTSTYTSNSVTGEETRVNGILGRSLNYDLSTYLNVANFVIPTGDWTFNFWFKISEDYIGTNDKERRIVSHNSLDLYYKEATETLALNMFDGTNTYSIETTPYVGETLKDKVMFCQLEYDSSNSLLNIYFDSVFEDALDTTGNLGFDDTNNLYLGTSFTSPTLVDHHFKGIVDELSFHNTIFTTDEKDFIYRTRFGDHKYLANTVYRVELTDKEKQRVVGSDANIYHILQGRGKANTANEELVYVSDGSTLSFTNETVFSPVVRGSLRLDFKNSLGIDTIVTDDSKGNLIGDVVSGSIDYNTGNIDLNFYKDFIVDNFVYSTSSETVVTGSLASIIQPDSFELIYTYLGISYVAVDNGIGSILGTNISSGTIDYNTGALSVTFSNATDIDKVIRYSYTYRLTDVPLLDSEITGSYQTENDLEITECGFEDANRELLQYTSFPSCKFGTPNAFLANDTIVRF